MRRLKKAGFLVPGAPLAEAFRDAMRAARAEVPGLEEALTALPGETWRRHWVVDIQPGGSGENAMDYLARYVQKSALDGARLMASDASEVTFSWRDRATGVARQSTLGGDEFLRRFLQHVLPGGFMGISFLISSGS